MSVLRRVVLDTCTLVSAALRVGSVPHQALLKALGSCKLCASSATLKALEQVLRRDKFDRYLDTEPRLSFVALICQHTHLFDVQEADELSVQPACRDPKQMMGSDTVLKVKRKNTIFWWLHNQGNRLKSALALPKRLTSPA